MADPQERNIDDILGQIETHDGEKSPTDIISNLQPYKEPTMTWPEVGTQALSNLPTSALNFGQNIVSAVTHPVQTAGNLMDVAAGTLRNITPNGIAKIIDKFDTNPEAAQRATNVADQLALAYKEKYGSSEGFKKALATNPVDILADAATLIAPVEFGLKINPMKGVGKVGASLLGETTGVGAESIQRAFKSGLEGDKSFWENLTGKTPMHDVLDTAKQNLENLRIQKNNEYRSGMVDIRNDKNILDFKDIDNALNDAKKSATYKGQIKNQKGYETYQKINDAIQDWKSLDPNEFHTPEGFDALKQKIGGIVEAIPYEEKTAKLVGSQVYNKLKNTINSQAPTYSNVMKDYADASDQIKEVERALSLKDTASADTAMRKLQSLTRNNVYTNYGNRLNLAKELEQKGGKPFLNALAGQSMSSITPRGLAGKGGLMGTLGTGLYMQNPIAALALPFQSPAAVGATLYGLGRGMNKISEFTQNIPTNKLTNRAMLNLISKNQEQQ